MTKYDLSGFDKRLGHLSPEERREADIIILQYLELCTMIHYENETGEPYPHAPKDFGMELD